MIPATLSAKAGKIFASLTFRLVLLGIIVALAVVAVKSCSSGRQAAEQGRQDTRSGEALAETARDAAATVIARSGEDASVDDLVAAATKEIENAPSDEAAGIAARAAICVMPDYRNDPDCRVQPIHP